MSTRIPFNRPHVTGAEAGYLQEAVALGHLSGNGTFGRRCSAWLTEEIDSAASFLLPSCTAALEMAMLLADIGPGDEVIMPSFTFVSTANAVVLRGGVPVFVDVLPDTLNISPAAIAAALTERTKAVVVVHYAGVGCDMEEIGRICDDAGVLLVEDAAHCLRAWYRDRPLGSFGALSTFSFHETKNVQCGEGGALVVNDPALVERAEILQEKGTNRRRFLRGQVDKYTWVDAGSSFLTSEVSAAFLWAQMEHAGEITARRLEIWDAYQSAFAALAQSGDLLLPDVPADRRHNAHLYALRLPDIGQRDAFIAGLRARDVDSVFHYVPLHDSPAGVRFGRTSGSLEVTGEHAGRLARLPVWVDMTDAEVARVIEAVRATVPALGTAASNRALR